VRPGRFERVLEVSLPDPETRTEMFGVHLAEVPVAAGEDLAVTGAHIRRAIEEVDRSVSEEMRETYDSYATDLT
jgi:SpoVK/Ycf46/Vps4 family AAA+-type ATPase